nr:MAG TPA: Protein of unknown function (DUF1642) [Caudoviricetes sp.]
MFEEKVEKPRTTSLRPLSYKDVLLKEFSRAVQENYTKNAQILREHREYIEYLEQELEKSRDLEGQANNQASYEYILKCEAETLLKEKQEQIVALKSQLDSQQSKLLEVPQFVAKWLDRKPLYAINGPIPVEIIEWSQKQTGYADLGRNINHLLKLKVNGYTVAKEKRFYLKNKLTGNFLMKWGDALSEDTVFTLQEESNKGQFTQQEIDSMETGSYEQIEVEE